MKYAFALAALTGLAAAQPHANHQHLHRDHQLHKKDIETVTDWTVVTVTDIVTVYGPSPASEPTLAANPPPAPASSPTSFSTPAPAPPSSAPAPPPSSAPAPAPAPAPSSSQAAIPAPAPAPSSQAAPAQPKPAQQSSAAPAPAPAQSAPASSGSGGSSTYGSFGTMQGASVAADCTEANPCQEGMTTYTTGLGACGYDDTTDNSQVVALQQNMFGTLTNTGVNAPANPLCNKKIHITNPATGATAIGVIRDRCVGCTGSGGIDLSPPLWAALNDNQPGNRVPVSWYFIE